MPKSEEAIRKRNTKYKYEPELILIRHAPVADVGRLRGRSDPAACITQTDIFILRAALPEPQKVLTSPAQRCLQTATALWPEHPARQDDRLWEQDFGAHEGLRYSELPDLGLMEAAELAQWAPPGGESFAALCKRVSPALKEYGRMAAQFAAPIALVVHAGVIRAALSQVLGMVHAGLAFEVGTLSVTRLRCGPEGPLSVIGTNL